MTLNKTSLFTGDLSLPVEVTQTDWATKAGIELHCLRLDLTDLAVSGNKWFKLARNIQLAKQQGHSQLLTFGGAFSNHILSTAYECSRQGIASVGVIRGEELNADSNPMLKLAAEAGMQLHFVPRARYRNKYDDESIALYKSHFGEFYIVPEGGSNQEGVEGCEAIAGFILNKEYPFDEVFLACGTSATCAGVIRGLSNEKRKRPNQAYPRVHGVSMFPPSNKESHSSWMKPELERFLNGVDYPYELHETRDLPAYGKLTEDLKCFISDFYLQTSILLDPIYTGKMLYYVKQLCEKNVILPSSKVLFIHTGGLHGWLGFDSPAQLSGTIKNRLSSL